MAKLLVVYDEGFEPAALQMIQDAEIQPAYIYGAGPWLVSDTPLSKGEVDAELSPPYPEDD